MMEIDVRIDEPEEPNELTDVVGGNNLAPPAWVSDSVCIHKPAVFVDSYQPPLAPASEDQLTPNSGKFPPPSRQLR